MIISFVTCFLLAAIVWINNIGSPIKPIDIIMLIIIPTICGIIGGGFVTILILLIKKLTS